MARGIGFPDDVRPDFEGFGKEGFRFLRGLAKNNEKAWYEAHRDDYESGLKFPMECLLAAFAPGSSKLPVVGSPKQGVFRIHRDVRFSKNKSPYKTHIGAVMTRSGGRRDPGLIYIHVQPGRSFIGAGFYAIDPKILTVWRRRMAEDPKPFLKIAKALEKLGPEIEFSATGTLKTLPRGFTDQADSPIAPYLRWKDFLLRRSIPDAAMQSREVVGLIRELGKAAAPLLDYGWAAYESAQDADPRRYMATAR